MRSSMLVCTKVTVDDMRQGLFKGDFRFRKRVLDRGMPSPDDLRYKLLLETKPRLDYRPLDAELSVLHTKFYPLMDPRSKKGAQTRV
jgi:hypothetical protein